MGKFIDLTGQRFGRLTVIERVENLIYDSSHQFARWKCKCDCGNETIVTGISLRQGKTCSCGCQIGGHKQNKYIFYEHYVIGYTNNEKTEFIIDIDDYNKIKDYCWVLNSRGYIHARNGKYMIALHRLIMDFPKKKMIDHINHNKLDNRKCNLRIVTNSQNQMNAKLNSHNSSGIKGVFWCNKIKRWKAVIRINGTLTTIGTYMEFKDAIMARKEAEDKYYGEYSYDNSMKIGEQNAI